MPYTDKQRIMDYRLTFGSEAGKRVLCDMIQREWFFSTTLHPEPHVMQFREGARFAVLEILEILGKKPEDMRDMIDEITDNGLIMEYSHESD